MERPKFLLLMAALATLFTAGSLSPALGAGGECTLAEKLSGRCPEVSGTVNGDGVDIRGSVDVPGSTKGSGRGPRGGAGVVARPDPVVVQRDGYTVTSPVTLADLVNFKPLAGVAHMEPNGWMVVGLATNFYATVEAGVQTGLLLEKPASVRFTAERFRWSYGDGTAAVLSVRGSSWAASGVGEFEGTATSHVFRRAGSYSIDLSIEFSAEYQYAGGPWIPISGRIPVAANRLVAVGVDAKTVLVGYDCTRRPTGPGC